MARRRVVRPRLERFTVDGAHRLASSSAERLVIPIDGKLSCEPTAALGPLDAVLLGPTEALTLHAAPPTTVYIASFER
jgi:hypothetical protein